MGRLKGRAALITGASRGIGRAIAERFASEGANVAINFATNADAAREVAGAAADTVSRHVSTRPMSAWKQTANGLRARL